MKYSRPGVALTRQRRDSGTDEGGARLQWYRRKENEVAGPAWLHTHEGEGRGEMMAQGECADECE